jgi:hypothetical protein
MASQLATNQVAMTGAAVKLDASHTLYEKLIVKAHADNTDPVYFGAAGVTLASGFELVPGEPFVFDNDNELGKTPFNVFLDTIYFIGTAGDRVCWVAGAPV